MLSRRVLSSVVAAFGAVALMAQPAMAQANGEAPEQDGAEAGGNPVEHCLPDRPDQEDGGDRAPGTPRETDTVRDRPDETDTVRDQPEDGTQDGTENQPEDGAGSGTAPAEPETDTARPDPEVAQCVAESLPDIVGNAHASSIVAVVSERIAQGYPDGSFRPQGPVNRGQMATFLTRALDLDVPEGAPDAPDVDADQAHADGIAAVIEAGIALGQQDGTFQPHQTVTRGQMAAFLTRALDLPSGGTQAQAPADAADSVHGESIEAVMGAEIAQGFADGNFRPQGPVTRGQMATFLARALDLATTES